MTAPLRRVLVRRPATAGDWVGAGWRGPDTVALSAQHEGFCTLVAGLGAEAAFSPRVGARGPGVEMPPRREARFAGVDIHDPLLTTARGGIPLRMRKPA